MVTVDGVSKRFGSTVALDGISFTAQTGITALAGPNGAGKTTLVRILSGVSLPSTGSVRVNGYDTSVDSIKARVTTGTVFENSPIYSGMTVSRYLKFIANLRGISGKDGDDRVKKVIDDCSLIEVENRLTDNLSRGFRQRTALASALIHDPSLVILDEPSSGLDPIQLADFWKLIKSFSLTRAIIISTHNMSEIEELDAFVILMNGGTILEQGSVKEILQKAGAADLSSAFISLVAGVKK
jgi:ABC-2 type transport system ATP-binding protein